MIPGLLYLVDANTLSEGARDRPNLAVVRRFGIHSGEIATAAPDWNEVLFGAWRLPPGRRRQILERYYDDFARARLPILPYDKTAAEWHATERARLASRGRTPSFADGQIAAIAFTHNLTLVTANTADFRDFADLRVEDWRA